MTHPGFLDLSMRILLVDDVPSMRSIVRSMLEDIGFKNIMQAEDGETAWRLIEVTAKNPNLRFSLILSDWVMEGMSGVELLRAVRSLPEMDHTPFLMITSQSDQAKINEALECGAAEFIMKPFNGFQLSEKITEAFS